MAEANEDLVSVGIVLPRATIKKIDEQRGDISRSLYIRRIIKEKMGA
jgi:hypothetical protein